LSRIEQEGYGIYFSHRLTPLTALNASGYREETTTSSQLAAKTTMTTIQAGVSTNLGAKTVGSLNARYTEFESPVNPYNETALIGAIAIFF